MYLKFRHPKRAWILLCLPLLFVILNVSPGYAEGDAFRTDENIASITKNEWVASINQQQVIIRGKVTDEVKRTPSRRDHHFGRYYPWSDHRCGRDLLH